MITRATETVRRLRLAGFRVVTAESCTAGLISAVLAQSEGAGEIVEGGSVVYSKDSKAGALGVDEDKTQGAVNAIVTAEMCSRALTTSKADIALAVTGVLGPNPGEDGNPVGMIYWAVAHKDGRQPRVVSKQYDRLSNQELRRHAVFEALALIEHEIREAQWAKRSEVASPSQGN